MQKNIVEIILYNRFFERLRETDMILNRMDRKDLNVAIVIAELVIVTVIITVFIFAFEAPTDFIGLLLITWTIIIFLLLTFFWKKSSK